ncbi:Uncharacterized protein TCM_018697 [Theobroma cacao]|uniref:Uncharacterized protein n=1 Tax=Theobroma cacao TaxID=3641 RepID=A0A061EF93_THECC|nr:Uncharacterized protein TCM_018697 [Theobroma cacao]
MLTNVALWWKEQDLMTGIQNISIDPGKTEYKNVLSDVSLLSANLIGIPHISSNGWCSKSGPFWSEITNFVTLNQKQIA